ncbi:hypothetical protein BJX70DRAFT_393482 [Aspergillus crustosus]
MSPLEISKLSGLQLLDLPNDLLLTIAQCTISEADPNRLSRTNQRFNSLLHDHRIDHNIKQGNSSALLWGAFTGHYSIVSYTLERDAPINIRAGPGDANWTVYHERTPLIIAAARVIWRSWSSSSRKAQRLIWATAITKNRTPLMLAIRERQDAVVGLLLGLGAGGRECEGLCSLLEHGAVGEDLLHIAADNGNSEVVELLLANGEDVNARAYNG